MSIVASLILVCLLQWHHAVLWWWVQQLSALGALCDAHLRGPTSLRKSRSLQLSCMLLYPSLGCAFTIA